jgi:hypothetical protein
MSFVFGSGGSFNMTRRILSKRSIAIGGCLILLSIIVILSGWLALRVDPRGPRLTEAQAIAIAFPAMSASMTPEHVNKYKPYRAELHDSIWNVFGSVPDGGAGGTPEAKVRDSDGKIIVVFHSQ